jgi:hypothetical protein
VVSLNKVVIPAVLAMLRDPPAAALRRTKMPSGVPTHLVNEWTLRDIIEQLRTVPKAAYVQRNVVQSCMLKLRDAGLVIESGHDRYVLDCGTAGSSPLDDT